jgi:hypothetical protein
MDTTEPHTAADPSESAAAVETYTASPAIQDYVTHLINSEYTNPADEREFWKKQLQDAITRLTSSADQGISAALQLYHASSALISRTQGMGENASASERLTEQLLSLDPAQREQMRKAAACGWEAVYEVDTMDFRPSERAHNPAMESYDKTTYKADWRFDNDTPVVNSAIILEHDRNEMLQWPDERKPSAIHTRKNVFEAAISTGLQEMSTDDSAVAQQAFAQLLRLKADLSPAALTAGLLTFEDLPKLVELSKASLSYLCASGQAGQTQAESRFRDQAPDKWLVEAMLSEDGSWAFEQSTKCWATFYGNFLARTSADEHDVREFKIPLRWHQGQQHFRLQSPP